MAVWLLKRVDEVPLAGEATDALIVEANDEAEARRIAQSTRSEQWGDPAFASCERLNPWELPPLTHG